MIDVYFLRTQRGGRPAIEFFEVRGHAGLADAGQDIVCAAVSALVQSTVIGLVEVVEYEPRTRMSEGYLRCQIDAAGMSARQHREAQVLMETLRLALIDIENQYPERMRVRVDKAGGEQNAQDSD